MTGDVPSPIDLRDPQDAERWEATAEARPGRADVFDAFVGELRDLDTHDLAVLELGSGPGFLAACLRDALPGLRLTLLDFSAPMHALARARLGRRVSGVRFVERNFRDPDWSTGLGPFDVVVTNQVVHELRHKRHARSLHESVRAVLKPGGIYLVSDHRCGEGGLKDDRLYMTAAEQRAALISAGFTKVRQVAAYGSLVMHRASCSRAGSLGM